MKQHKPKSYWLTQSWGGYKLIDNSALPEAWGPRSNLRVSLVAPNGHIKDINFRSLHYHKEGRRANSIAHKSKWLSQKFGSLILLDIDLPEFFSKTQKLDVHVKCDCGKTAVKHWQYVHDGNTKTCGECLTNTKDFWMGQRYNKLQILPEHESKSNVSRNMFEELKSYYPDAQYSVRGILPHRELDIWIPSQNLAIEYNGCYWHSEAQRGPHEKLKDYEKYSLLSRLGIRNIQIYSDEWDNHKNIILDLILGEKAHPHIKRIYNIEYKFIQYSEAKTFLDKFHYLSGHKHSATIYIGAFNRDVLVGCWLFQKNSSDSRTWEWSRAAWNHDFTAWNPHQRALNFFLENIKECGSLITFSENRLFTGAMYSKLGFCLEKTLPPDYCYTNGIVRKHKFLFRVQAGTSEIDNAAAHNFYRLWDCGKKKWRFNI